MTTKTTPTLDELRRQAADAEAARQRLADQLAAAEHAQRAEAARVRLLAEADDCDRQAAEAAERATAERDAWQAARAEEADLNQRLRLAASDPADRWWRARFAGAAAEELAVLERQVLDAAILRPALESARRAFGHKAGAHQAAMVKAEQAARAA